MDSILIQQYMSLNVQGCSEIEFKNNLFKKFYIWVDINNKKLPSYTIICSLIEMKHTQ